MDPQVQGQLDAIGHRLLELARTNPEGYIATRMVHERWWPNWQEEHWDEIEAVENAAMFRLLQEGIARLAATDPDPEWAKAPLPDHLRPFFPQCATMEDFRRVAKEGGEEVLMQALTKGPMNQGGTP